MNIMTVGFPSIDRYKIFLSYLIFNVFLFQAIEFCMVSEYFGGVKEGTTTPSQRKTGRMDAERRAAAEHIKR